jgi:chromosome transmission fidelity protein 18
LAIGVDDCVLHSDDRTANRFKSKLESATEMRSEVFGGFKPNLLVIDEIDGLAPSEGQGAVDVLLGLIGEKGKSAKKKLNRPIICICNDQYVEVLCISPHCY